MSDSDPTPGSQPARRRGFWTFWTTLPGILTGSAAVITAIVGLITLLNGFGGDGNNAVASDHGSVTSSQVVATTTSRPATASNPLPEGVLVQGDLTMKSPDIADLEKGVVGSGVSGGDLYLYCSAGSCLLNAVGSGLMTAIDVSGNKSACAAALESRHDQALDPSRMSKGETLCLQTNDGHIAALQIIGLPGVGTVEFVFSYTLWR